MEREAQAVYPFFGGLARFDARTGGGYISPAYLDRTGRVVWQGE